MLDKQAAKKPSLELKNTIITTDPPEPPELEWVCPLCEGEVFLFDSSCKNCNQILDWNIEYQV